MFRKCSSIKLSLDACFYHRKDSRDNSFPLIPLFKYTYNVTFGCSDSQGVVQSPESASLVELVRNSLLSLPLENQKLWSESPETCVLTALPGNSDATEA